MSWQEYYQVPTNVQDIARSVGVMVERSKVGDPATCGNFCPMEESSTGFCADQPFGLQKGAPMSCTAFLIAPDLFATAGHCLHAANSPWPASYIPSLSCQNVSVVMRFRSDPTRPNGDSNFVFQSDQIYKCAEVVAHGNYQFYPITEPVDGCDPRADPNCHYLEICEPGQSPPACIPRQMDEAGIEEDWAIFRVDRAVAAPRLPLLVASHDRQIPVGGNVMLIGYPRGLPLKVDLQGELIERQPSWFRFRADNTQGHSGAPVFDGASPVVAGILSQFAASWEVDAETGFPKGSTIPNLDPRREDGGPECVTHTVCLDGDTRRECTGTDAVGLWNVLLNPAIPKGSITQAASGDYDKDGLRDRAYLYADELSDRFMLDVEFGKGTAVRGINTGLVNLDVGTQALNTVAQMLVGDFDADGYADLVLLINGQLQHYRGTSTGLARSNTIVPIENQYTQIRVGDFNGDGRDDLQAIRNPIDVYYGSASGLTTGVRMQAFPSGTTDDGKYVVVSGDELQTVNIATLRLDLAVAASTPRAYVEIFDGDVNTGDGDFSAAPGGTCFRLLADPNGDGVSDGVVAQVFSDTLAHQAWSKLYDGLNDARARTPSGNYNYMVEAFIASSCAAPVDNTISILNGFKVRGAGNLSLPNLNASFLGADFSGRWASRVAHTRNKVDTSFAGSFEFGIDVGGLADLTGAEIVLRDADADFLNDRDGNASIPGVADGANDVIRYQLLDPSGTVALTNTDPSGDYNESTGPGEIEERRVAVNGRRGLWKWRWTDVWTENNVHIWAPQASPTTYRLYGEGVTPAPIPLSSARKPEDWLARSNEISAYLPIVLGDTNACNVSIGSTKVIRTLLDAKAVLNGLGSWYDPLSYTSTYATLMKELLTVKLNVALAQTRGENLRNALVYPGTESVGQVADAADLALSKRCRFQLCTPLDYGIGCWREPINLPSGIFFREETSFDTLTIKLKAVNAAEVTQRRPPGM